MSSGVAVQQFIRAEPALRVGLIQALDVAIPTGELGVFSHIFVGVGDFERALGFYEPLLSTLAPGQEYWFVDSSGRLMLCVDECSDTNEVLGIDISYQLNFSLRRGARKYEAAPTPVCSPRG